MPLSLAQPGYQEPSPCHVLTPASLTPLRTGVPLPAACTPREAQPLQKTFKLLGLIQIIYVDLIV